MGTGGHREGLGATGRPVGMVTPTGRCNSSCIRCVLQAGVLVVPATLGSAGAGGGCSGVWAAQGTPWRDPPSWYGQTLPWHWLWRGSFLGEVWR